MIPYRAIAFISVGAAAAEARDQGSQEIRQDVDLQQADEARRHEGERADRLAEEQADQDAGADSQRIRWKTPAAARVRGGHD